MSRLSQFLDFANTRNLSDKGNISMYYKTKLTAITINNKTKEARKKYLKRIGKGYAPISEYK